LLKEVIVAAALALAAPTGASADEHEPTLAETFDTWIDYYSTKYSIENDPHSQYDAPTLAYHVRRVSLCETANWTDFVGDNGNSIGPMQMHIRGIYWSTPQAKAGYPREDYEANFAAGAYLISRGHGPQHWVHCWRYGR
jgi:hypothetical protein